MFWFCLLLASFAYRSDRRSIFAYNRFAIAAAMYATLSMSLAAALRVLHLGELRVPLLYSLTGNGPRFDCF